MEGDDTIVLPPNKLKMPVKKSSSDSVSSLVEINKAAERRDSLSFYRKQRTMDIKSNNLRDILGQNRKSSVA